MSRLVSQPPTLFDLLDNIPLRIVGGDRYHWDCYGRHARYLDFESNVDCVFDEKTALLYEVRANGEQPEESARLPRWPGPVSRVPVGNGP